VRQHGVNRSQNKNRHDSHKHYFQNRHGLVQKVNRGRHHVVREKSGRGHKKLFIFFPALHERHSHKHQSRNESEKN